MIVLARVLARLALLSWTPDARRNSGRETAEALVRGVEKRVSRGEGAWAYLTRALTDILVTGAHGWTGTLRRAASPALFGGLRTDLSLAARRLRLSPGTTLSAILILALGIGVNTAVYSAMRAVVLSDPPLPEAGELGLVRRAAETHGDTVWGQWSYPEVRELREASEEVLPQIAGYTLRRQTIQGPGDPETVGYELVTPGYFRVLSQRPVLGRWFTPEEEGIDAAPNVAVLSHGLWLRRFGGDPGAIGGTITLVGSSLQIVGVAPPGFNGLSGDAELWVPVGQSRPNLGNWGMEWRHIAWLEVIARVDPGLDRTVVSESLRQIGATIEAVQPRSEQARVSAEFVPISDLWINPTTRTSIRLTMAGALAVLAIVVINLSALLLVRDRRRARSIAVQLALGAGRGRLVRERVIESLLLTGVGGVIGLALAFAGIRLFGGLWPDYAFRGSAGYLRLLDGHSLALDGTAMALGLTVAAGAGLLASLVPVLMQGRTSLTPALKAGARGKRAPASDHSRAILLGSQVALAVVLLVASGLLGGTILSLRARQVGFDPDRLLVLSYSLAGRPAIRSQETTRAFHAELRRRLASLPEVTSVTVSSDAPLRGGFMTTRLSQVDGLPAEPEDGGPEMGVHVIDDTYFSTLGTRIIRGRGFTPAETVRSERVVILNQSAATRFFGSGDPVGRRIRYFTNVTDPDAWWTVVGVVEDVLYRSPTEGVLPAAFIPLGVWAPVGLTAMVRTSGAPSRVVPAARAELAEIDPAVAYSTVQTGSEMRAQDIAQERALGVVVVVFTALAVFLSAAGLWATVAQSVTERHREIGIRLAVGAEAGAVRTLFVRQRMGAIAGGGAVGLVASLGLGKRMEDVIFGIPSDDPRVFALAAGFLLAVCLLATWIPTAAATRVDPVRALRSE